MPEAWWVVGLWKKHKLEHEQFLELSLRLRDGHDKRRTNCEIVQAGEMAAQYQNEREVALQMLARRGKPFKPLSPAVEAWRMHYEDLDDRYKMLIVL